MIFFLIQLPQQNDLALPCWNNAYPNNSSPNNDMNWVSNASFLFYNKYYWASDKTLQIKQEEDKIFIS